MLYHHRSLASLEGGRSGEIEGGRKGFSVCEPTGLAGLRVIWYMVRVVVQSASRRRVAKAPSECERPPSSLTLSLRMLAPLGLDWNLQVLSSGRPLLKVWSGAVGNLWIDSERQRAEERRHHRCAREGILMRFLPACCGYWPAGSSGKEITKSLRTESCYLANL